jgi:hypothetical protein
VGVQDLDEHLGAELLQVVEADEDRRHLLDDVVEGRLIAEQVVPTGWPTQHPRHLPGGPQ